MVLLYWRMTIYGFDYEFWYAIPFHWYEIKNHKLLIYDINSGPGQQLHSHC